MGKTKPPQKAKLLTGIIFSDNLLLEKAKKILSAKFGGIDFESRVFKFTHTQHYQREMGDGLNKVFLGFCRLICPEKIASFKIFTNRVEKKFSIRGRRRLNIDPGYLNLARLVLVSTKDYSHRIYLNAGIYAEITLIYKRGEFRPCEWTYPDLGSPEYIAEFHRLRELYARQIKEEAQI